MARPRKIKEDIESTVIALPQEEVITVTPVVRSAEYLRVAAVYEEFKSKYPDKWEREKEVLLAKLNNL
jgi:hypothetical protein